MTTEIEEQKTISFEDGLAMLEEEQQLNLDPPKVEPKTLPLSKIKLAHSIFQPRQFNNGSLAYSEDHIRYLESAIWDEASHTLDPIHVWWSGTCYRLIDGHHRMQAYIRVNKTGRLHEPMVPVLVFKGDLTQALAESIRLNSKDKLPMDKSDKYNRAWKLTVINKHSKSSIASICKVGTSTISRMRNIYNDMKDKNPDEHFGNAINQSWEDAQKFGKKDREFDDGWERKLALDWAKRIGKTFGTKPTAQPMIFAMALEEYSENLVSNLTDRWSVSDDF